MTSTQKVESERNYVLITPIKNELQQLSQLIRTVLGQSQRPLIWIIVDGRSSDGSYETARSMTEKYDWIHIVLQKKFHDVGYSHKNLFQAVNEGYEHARQIAVAGNLDFSFVGKTDSTPILSSNYFEALALELIGNPKLAIVCGRQKSLAISHPLEIRQSSLGEFAGFNDIRLYRRDFFESVGEYPLTYSSDTVLLIKAKKRGWDIMVTDKTHSIEPRLGGSTPGIWKGYQLKGRALYSLGNTVSAVILNAIYHSIIFSPHYIGIPMLQGYMIGLMNKEERIDDEEVLTYYGNRSVLREMLSH